MSAPAAESIGPGFAARMLAPRAPFILRPPLFAAIGIVVLMVVGLPGWLRAGMQRGGADLILFQNEEARWVWYPADGQKPSATIELDFNYVLERGLGWARIEVLRGVPRALSAEGLPVDLPRDFEDRVVEWASRGLAPFDSAPPDRRAERAAASGLPDGYLEFLGMIRDGVSVRRVNEANRTAQLAAAWIGVGLIVFAVALLLARLARRAALERAVQRWRARKCPACAASLRGASAARCHSCGVMSTEVLRSVLDQLGRRTDDSIDSLLVEGARSIDRRAARANGDQDPAASHRS